LVNQGKIQKQEACTPTHLNSFIEHVVIRVWRRGWGLVWSNRVLTRLSPGCAKRGVRPPKSLSLIHHHHCGVEEEDDDDARISSARHPWLQIKKALCFQEKEKKQASQLSHGELVRNLVEK